MAHLGRIEVVVTDPTTGLPDPSATVEIRKQGGTVQGTTGPTTINVHTTGSFAVGDTVNLDNDADTPVQILASPAPTPTQITVGGAGLSPLVNDVSRITAALPLPTVYNDRDGTEAKSNPLSTDANGLAFCYAPMSFYDAIVTRGAVKTLLRDIVAVGGTSFLSNVFNDGSGNVAYLHDTERALTVGDLIQEWRNAGVLKMSLTGGGTLVVSGIEGPLFLSSGALTIQTGGILFSGSAPLDFSAIAAAKIIAGITDFVVRDNADANDNFRVIDAGDAIALRDFIGRRHYGSVGTALGTGDWALSAGWGDATTKNVSGNDTRGWFSVEAGGAGIAANPTVTVTFKDGVYSSAPFAVVVRGDNDAPTTGWWQVVTPAVGTYVFRFVGTPTSGNTYILYYNFVG